MLAVSAGVGEGVEVDAPDAAILVGTQTQVQFHLMAGSRRGLALLPGKDNFRGFPGLPGHEGRIDFADGRLLGTKTTADAGLRHPHHGFGDVQGIGDDTPGVEHDLGGTEHIQAAVCINGAIGAEGLHHGLLTGFGVVNMVDDDIAVVQHRVDVAVAALIVGAEIALVVGSHGAEALPVLFRMDEDWVILGGVIIQYRFQHFILHFDEFQRFIDAFIIFTCHDGNHVAREAHMAVDEQAVIGAGLGVSLACLGVAAGILRHILPGKDGLDARHFFCHSGIDILHDSVGMGRTEQFDDKAVAGNKVIHIDRLTGHELHGIFFAKRFVDRVHLDASCFDFFQARKFWMPRS